MPRILNGLVELRDERDWTQGQLANVVGVSRQSINNIERGKHIPSLELALKFSRVFGCPADEIFWLDESEQESIP